METLNVLPAFKQAKDVIDIRLRNKSDDISSLIKLNIEVDGNKLTLWLPAMFVAFSEYREGSNKLNDSRSKTVVASKIFSSEVEAQKVIPALTIKGQGLAYLTLRSSVHEGPLKLQWLPNNRLEITTSQKWLDLVSFLFFDYH